MSDSETEECQFTSTTEMKYTTVEILVSVKNNFYIN